MEIKVDGDVARVSRFAKRGTAVILETSVYFRAVKGEQLPDVTGFWKRVATSMPVGDVESANYLGSDLMEGYELITREEFKAIIEALSDKEFGIKSKVDNALRSAGIATLDK